MACEDDDMETNGTPKSLVTKLAEVMSEVERVAKHGRNDFHRYDYATEADIVAAVRKHMAERHLMLVPTVTKLEWRELAAKEQGKPRDPVCTMTVDFRVLDGDNPDAGLVFTVIGEGQDAGDKATYKAMTGATKYALLKLFLIPTGDDPEQDGQQAGSREKSSPRGAQASARPTPAQLDAEVRQNFPPGIEAEQVDPRPAFLAGKLECPNCGRRVFKRKDGSAWFCWQQKGGCGGQWAAVVTASGAAVDTATGEVQGDFEGDRDFLVKAVNGALRGFTDTERTAIFQQKLHGKTPQDATTKDLHDAYLWLGDPEVVKAWRKERAA
jgi:hypothetical protein